MDEKLPRTELRRYFVLVKCWFEPFEP
jgi:hypothetical protein